MAVIRAASGGALRRVVQSAVVLGVLMFSTAAALLALAMLTSANQGFATSFAKQHEAELAVTINSSKVTGAELERTRHLSGVTAAAGPYQEATVTVSTGGGGAVTKGGGAVHTRGSAGATNSTTFTVVGRASPGGALHRVSWNNSLMCPTKTCRWPSAPGEISIAQSTSIRVPLGAPITVTSAPGRPKLTVVGYSSQTVLYDGGWVTPSEISRLRAPGAPVRDEMLYDFSRASTSSQLSADLKQIERVLGPGAVAGSQSYLFMAQGTAQEQAVNTPFITTFAIIALVLAVLIVANVVSAAVIASYRRIGVLKSIGFTPAQVTAVYLTQIGLPAIIGAVIGAILGNHWALPLIQMAPIPTQVSVPTWIDIIAPAAMLALTGLAAAVPALRAGRMSAVQAIAAGQAPPAGRGYRPHRLAARLPLPRPVTVGLTAPLSRPARSAITLLSITGGLTAVVIAVGLTDSIHKINHSSIQGLGQIQIVPRGVRGAPFTPGQAHAALAALRAQPATEHYLAESDEVGGEVGSGSVHVPGGAPPAGPAAPVTIRVTGSTGPTLPLEVRVYDSSPAWLGWALIGGHWYRHADQVDVNPQLLAKIHKKVGQEMTFQVDGRPVTVRIAGEVFAPNPTPELFLSARTLGPAAAKLGITSYDINLSPGAGTNAYIHAVGGRLGSHYWVLTPAGPSVAAQIRASYFHLLAVLICVLAALGVLNSVLMATRERVHDLGVYKALGMTPAQTIEMVLCWVIIPVILAAAVSLPVGLVVQDDLVRHLARSSADLILPGSFVHVLGAGELALLTLAGLVIAAAGALGPAAWAAVSRTTTALRAE